MINTAFCKKLTITLLLVALVATSFLCCFAPSVAHAYTYGGTDTSSLWYYGEDFLNVASAKQVVSGWDLSEIKEPIVIAVIDTGINAGHELFKNVLLKNADGDILGYNSTTKPTDGNVIIADDSNDSHGTAIAGTIAMLIKEFNLEDYIKIYPIKANKTDSTNEFSIESLTKAIEWASTRADVINMSLGFTSENYKAKSVNERNAFETAIESARRQAVIVGASGNKATSSSANDEGYAPASLPGVIGAMSQTANNTLADKSHYGANYTLCAPGTNIYTASVKGYQTVSGTSQASAITSFASALLKLRLEVEGKTNDAIALANIISNISKKTISHGESKYGALDLAEIVSIQTDSLVNYVKPTDIELMFSGATGTGDYANSIYMRADDVKELALIARVLPIAQTDPDLEQGIEWYIYKVSDEGEQVGEQTLIGKGASINYTPTKGGQYEIVAKHPSYDITSKPQSLYVEFGNYYVGEVRVTLLQNAGEDVNSAPSRKVLYTHEKTSFALTGVKYLDDSVETKWFVNGEYVSSGSVFDFKPTKSGTYYITAQYGNQAEVDFQFKFTAEVKSVIAKPLYLSLLIVGCVLVIGGTVTAIAVVNHKKKSVEKED